MIYEYFRATRAYEAVQGLSDLFTINLQNDDVRYFGVRWDQAFLPVSQMTSNVLLERLYKSKLQKLQTVLALYGQETDRNNGHDRRQLSNFFLIRSNKGTGGMESSVMLFKPRIHLFACIHPSVSNAFLWNDWLDCGP